MESSFKTPDIDAFRQELATDSDSAMDDDERRAWAVAMTVPGQARALPMPRDARNGEASPGAWRPGDVSLTMALDDVIGSVRRSGAGDAAAARDDVVTRLATTVNVENLGRLAFSVDRSAAGVRIVIEVDSDRAAFAIESERLTLLRTLRAAGLTVLAFRVLVNGQAGPTLAQHKSKSNVSSDPNHTASPDSESESRDRRKRLRVVG